MLKDCTYDMVKILKDLSELRWFVQKHAKDGAKEEGHELYHAVCEDLEKDLDKHIEKLRQTIEGVSKEGKLE